MIETCRIITGCLKATPIPCLYALAGIAPSLIHRKVASNADRCLQQDDPTHPLHGQRPANHGPETAFLVQHNHLTPQNKETTGSISSEYRDTVIESEVEHVTEGEDTSRQLIRSGTHFLATHGYEKNQDGPMGNELDLNEGDTVVYLMKHDDNEHWWLVEDGKGQVGYVPAGYIMIIIDETLQEEESDTNRKEGHEKRTDGTKIGGEMGRDGERRKKYSAAVIDGIKRKSRIFVGYSIVKKTDSRLSKGRT